MTDCCAHNTLKTASQACPRCETTSKRVEMRTLYHHVRFPDNQAIISDNYYFCPSKDCATAYFSTSGNNIAKQQLTTYQDIQDGKLCYCFDIDVTEYLLTITTNHSKAVKNFVIERTKLGECACEFRNPSGQCCLGKFKQLDLEFKNGFNSKL